MSKNLVHCSYHKCLTLYFSPDFEEYFNERYSDILERYGYRQSAVPVV